MKIPQGPVKPVHMHTIPLLSGMCLLLIAFSWSLLHAGQDKCPEINVEPAAQNALESQVSCTFSETKTENATAQ